MFGRGDILFHKVDPCDRGRMGYLWGLQTDELGRDQYYEGEPFRSSRILLGFLGGLPFTWKKPHMPSCHLVESTFVVAIITVFVLGLFEYHLVVSCYHTMLDDNLNLRDTIILFELELCSFWYFMYFALWVDVPAAEKAIKCWLQLGSLYYRMTGQLLSHRRPYLEKIINTGILVFPPVSLTFAKYANPQIRTEWAYYPVIMFTGSVLLASFTLWIAYFNSLEKFAKNINVHIKKNLRNGSLTFRKLQEYREVWLQMRCLSKYLSSMWSPIGIYAICTILDILLCYEIIVSLEFGHIISAFAHIYMCICCTYIIHFMANTSTNAVEEIKEFYNHILSRESMYMMTANEQREVVGVYLARRAASPAPSYGGYVVLNRGQALSVFATISSYLVLLMQFSQKVNELESGQNILKNATNV